MQLAGAFPAALGNHLWQSTIFTAIAACLAFTLRNNRAQARHALWLAASLKFLVPFSLFVAAGAHISWPSAVPVARPAIPAAMRQIGHPFAAAQSVWINSTSAATVGHAPWQTFLLLVWLCGLLVVTLSWLRRWMRIRAMVRSSKALSIPAPIPVLSTSSLLEPGIFGIIRPVLLLPEGIVDRLESAHLDAILAHELCHVRRRDNLIAFVHMMVEALFWFHPLVWWIGSRLTEERERACDEEVLRLGNQPQVYAESILKTCQFYLESPLPCVSGVTGSDLKKRVVQIMTAPLSAKLNLRKKLVLATAAVAAVAVPIAAGLAEQAESHDGLPHVSFDVASVRLSQPGTENTYWDDHPGRMTISGGTIRALLEQAFGIWSYQISGPGWLESRRYDIAAEMPASTIRKQRNEMIQSLLMDRFKLAFHWEEKVLPVFVLRVAQGGPKMQLATPDGKGRSGATTNRTRITADNSSMAEIADVLSRYAGRAVIDETGLKGGYNFELQFSPGDEHADFGAQSESLEDSGPSIFVAVQEQLGLKLVRRTRSLRVLAIDHIEETPTEN